MQRRLVRKLDLEMLLSKAEPHPIPKPSLEQYTVPADVAATMLHIAAQMNEDIEGKTVLDLGCGTGRLALGAAFFGARRVVGIDLDKTAIETAVGNSRRLRLRGEVEWIVADIDAVHGCFDTVVQNPPYGVQTQRADRRFIARAIQMGKKVYSLHKSLHRDSAFVKKLKANSDGFAPVAPSPFLERFIEMHGGRIVAVYAMVMSLPHMFSFHSRERYEFVVDLYVLEAT
jgi:putative methylase